MTDQTPYWIALSSVAGIGPARFRLLLDFFGDAERAWGATYGDLVAAGLESRVADALLEARLKLDLQREMERLQALEARVLTWESEDYPERLREIEAAPPLLYVLGHFQPQDSWAVAVVGTRRITGYGRATAAQLAGELAQAGITVVSGMAQGSDTVAHQTALDSGGRTIAVLGSGVDVIYPPQNRHMARRIVEEGQGAIVSEHPLGAQPLPANFPARNRIISGLSLGVLVVEAAEKSGALITVGFALEQGREVFAVPGPITSRMSYGTNRLIQNGAKLVTCAADILEELQIGRVQEQIEAAQALPADPTERMLLQLLHNESLHIDDITNQSGLPASTVSALLTMMELKGMVRHLGGMVYGAR